MTSRNGDVLAVLPLAAAVLARRQETAADSARQQLAAEFVRVADRMFPKLHDPVWLAWCEREESPMAKLTLRALQAAEAAGAPGCTPPFWATVEAGIRAWHARTHE